jgi:hypothetical protein
MFRVSRLLRPADPFRRYSAVFKGNLDDTVACASNLHGTRDIEWAGPRADRSRLKITLSFPAGAVL